MRTIFNCENCNYKCSKKCDFNKHTMTAKHKKSVSRAENERNSEINICIKCNYECGNKSDYVRHILTAKHKNNDINCCRLQDLCVW